MRFEAVTYQHFLDRMRFTWKQGEHISLIGPTGSGKTVAARDLIALRDYVVVIATKAKDASLDRYRLKRRSSWPPEWHEERVLLWVKPKQLGNFSNQAAVIYDAMNNIYRTGGWTIYLDDVFYVSSTLGMKRALQMMYTQARSNHVTMIGSLQRPRNVPIEVVNQSRFALVFRIRDKLDIERVAEEMSIPSHEVKQALDELVAFEFVLLETGKEPVIVHPARM